MRTTCELSFEGKLGVSYFIESKTLLIVNTLLF